MFIKLHSITTMTTTSERYEPSTGCFRISHSMSSICYYRVVDAMNSLSPWVVIAGDFNAATIVTTANMYDPITETISVINLAFPIYVNQSEVLNGRLLVLVGDATITEHLKTGQVLTILVSSAFVSVTNTVSMSMA